VARGERLTLRVPFRPWWGAAVLTMMSLGACRPAAASSGASALQTLSDSLRVLAMPAAASGVMMRDSTWRVFAEGDSTLRLYLIHPVADLVLPDGPFELLAPLTYFRFEDERWMQATQDRGGVTLPPVVATALATEFTDRERVYFYRIRFVDAGQSDESAANAPLRAVAQAVTTEVARLRKAGFIGADAEP
jgi:hypothetical protein